MRTSSGRSTWSSVSTVPPERISRDAAARPLIDTLCLAIGLAVIGMNGALLLGLLAAVLGGVPFIGSIIGCVIVVLVAATDFPIRRRWCMPL